MNTTKTPTFLSLNQAAKACGRAKSTLSKALKSGKLSYVSRDESGSYKLDLSEVLRVFPDPASPRSKNQLSTPDKTHENSALERELDLMREMYEKMERIQQQQIESLTDERNRWREEATANRRLLEDQSRKQEGSGFMARLFGKGAAA